MTNSYNTDPRADAAEGGRDAELARLDGIRARSILYAEELVEALREVALFVHEVYECSEDRIYSKRAGDVADKAFAILTKIGGDA